jgi:hypothetical protein
MMFKKITKRVIKSIREFNREDFIEQLPLVLAAITTTAGIISAFGATDVKAKPDPSTLIINNYYIKEDKNAKTEEQDSHQ